MSGPSVSVVINTVNRAGHLARALEALRLQRYRDFEVVVVNGPSSDGTPSVLARQGGDVKVARCPALSLGMSRNIGIAFSAGEVVAFLDDDAVPEPSWLDRLAAAYADPSVGVAGGPILDHTGTAWQVRLTVCDRMGRARHPAALDPALADAGPGAAEFPCPTGANSSFRREALVQVGGFDEAIAWFLDETEVSLRVLDAGWKVRLVEDAVVHHKYAASHIRTPDRLPRDLYQPLSSIAYFAMTHGLPALGREAALSRVLREVGRRLTDIAFLKASRAITGADAERLSREVRDGARDGMRLAFDGPRGTRPPGDLDRPLAPFLPFAAGLPAADRLRVCLVSQDYPPGKVGGIGVWTRNLAVSMAALGHEVSVVCRGGADTVDFEDGVWVHRIVPRRRPPGLLADLPRPMADYANSVRDEVHRIRAMRGVDVVSAPIWDLEGEALRREGIVPTVTSLHTTYGMSLPSKPEWTRHKDYFEGHVAPIIRAEERIVRESGALLANSEAIVHDVARSAGRRPGPDEVRLVPHGLAEPSPPVHRPSWSRDGRVRVLYVGRLEMRKGIDVLVEALDEVLSRHPEADVAIVGDETNDFPAPWRETVARAAATRPHMGRVSFTGFVSPDELARRYASCDVFVAPSRYESFGLIYLEAMMQGKPCVGTTAGGIPEVVAHGVTGLLAEPGDAASLASCLEALVSDAGMRQRLGRAGRERFEGLFSSSAMAAGAVEAYRHFLTRREYRVDVAA